jgi:uncharacterized protein (TIGR02147 family)
MNKNISTKSASQSPFEFEDYRQVLEELIRGRDAKRGKQTELAAAMGCQPSYLLQVLKQKAELTEDHGLKLCQHLGYDDPETEYFVLMLRMARAATPELVRFLERKRAVLQREARELGPKVEARSFVESEKFLSQYFASWVASTLHIATSAKKYQTVSALAERFALPLETVEANLKFLEKAELVVREGKTFSFAGGSVHLPRHAALNTTHQTSRRMQALRSIEINDDEDVHFSSVFTLDRKTYLEIRKQLRELIADAHRRIHAGGTDEVYGLCLDLFRVI